MAGSPRTHDIVATPCARRNEGLPGVRAGASLLVGV